MKSSDAQIQRIGHSKALHTVVFAIAMISFSLSSSIAWATTVAPTDYRIVAANGKFADTTQFAVVFKIRPPRRLRARRLELAMDMIGLNLTFNLSN